MPVMRGGRGVDISNYLFVDANYLRRGYEKTIQTYFGTDGALDLQKLKRKAQAAKVFYYDSVDPDARDVDAREAELRRIQRLPGFHVRQGSVTGKGRKRRQKQVDVQLAVDMLSHAVRKNYWHATLVAGDLDFLPLIEELVLLGAHVHVFCERGSGAEELLDAADAIEEMGLRSFWEISTDAFQRDHPIPTVTANDQPPRVPVVATGMWNGRTVTRFHIPEDRLDVLYVAATPDAYSLRLTFQNWTRLEEYFETEFGKIENWAQA